MTGLVFILAIAALPLIGLPFLRLPVLGPLPPAARVGLAGGLGALAICLEMWVLSWLGWRWTVWLLLLPPIVLTLTLRARREETPKSDESLPRSAWAATALILGTITYAAGTARATATDFLVLWGPQGERFGLARGIDVAFGSHPFPTLMHAGYPPMLPCLYAWGTLVAGRLAWGAALLSLPIFVTLTALTFYGFAQPVMGRRSAAQSAGVLTALLGLLAVADPMAGGAEPLLLYFEVLALSALAFARRQTSGLAAAAVGLTGAVLTKVEGTVFAGLVAILYVALGEKGQRRKAAAVLAVAPGIALAAWLVFCRQHGFVDAYRWGVPTVREMALQSFHGVEIAAAIAVAVLLLRRPLFSRAGIPLVVAAGFVGVMIFLALTHPEGATVWAAPSAPRLLLTPMICCFVAGAAATEADDL